MKTLKIILCALCVCGFIGRVCGQFPAAVGPGVSQASPHRKPSYHNHPATPLLFEDFENPSGYDLAGWGEVIVAPGVVNEDFTSTVLYGTQSLSIELPGDDQTFATNSFAASGHVWVAFRLRITSAIAVDSMIVGLYDNAGNCQAKITRNSDSDFKVWALCSTEGQVGFGPSLNTTVTVWMEWNKNNGANSVATLAWSTSGVRPTSGDQFVSVTAATTATDVSVIRIGSAAGTDDIHFIIDHVLVDNEQIISYP